MYMKKIFTILFISCLAALGFAQDTFQDDFESYGVGEYPSATNSNWTTWSGTTGNAEDVRVTDALSASGTNSLYFEGAGGGGPQDVILDFGGVRNSGTFTFTSKFYCEQGKGAYFNFQGGPAVASWSLNCFMNPDGSLTLDDVQEVKLTTSYPQGEWFELSIEANLTYNFWRVFMNGNCIGSFENGGLNAVSMLDLYPIDGNFDFYVDDISYSYTDTAEEPVEIVNDVALTLRNTGTIGISGDIRSIEGVLTNTGQELISDLALSYVIDGAQYAREFENLGLAPGLQQAFTLDETVTLSESSSFVEVSVVSISDVNSEEIDDDNICNNNASIKFSGFTPEPGRKVLVEEATGTWCGWCPRGDVFMNAMDERYPDHFVGIAVHGGDPMEVDDWSAGVESTTGFTGYPSAVVGRTILTDPSAIESNIVARLQTKGNSLIENGAIFDEATRELTIITYTTFEEQAVGDYRLVVGITEDGVTGYAQTNYYAGGGNGPMGGYEDLPDPVPASEMVYNHTARALLTPYGGIEDAFSTSIIINPGTYEHGFTYVVPDGYNVDNLHIITAVLGPQGVVDNVQSTTIASSVDTKDYALEQGISISPNPTADFANLRVQLDEQVDLNITLMDAMGKLVAQKNYGQVIGDMIFPIDVSTYPVGVYYVRIQANDGFATKKIIVTK